MSRIASTGSVERVKRAIAWLTWAALWSPGCSLMLRADDKQCMSDADCSARGLVGAVCLAEVCQRPSAAPGGGAGTLSSGVSAELPMMATGVREDASSMAPEAGGGGVLATPTNAGAGARAVGSSAGAIAVASGMAGAAPRAGSSGSSSSGSAGKAGASAPCEGAACPECSVDADCERRMPGSVCRSATCWMATPQCKTDAECVARGAEFMGGKCSASQCLPNPRWRCDTPPPTNASTEIRKLKLLVRDSLSLNPVANLKVVACQKLDLTCSQPIKDVTTGTDGYLTIELPANFAGYLQQTERREYLPAMYFLPPALPADGMLQPFPLLGSGVIFDALAAALGGTIDPKRGHMMLIAEDCMGTALAGVTFMSPQRDAQTVQFYVRDLLPSTTAMDTAEIGNGGFLNFPAGTAVINVAQPKTSLDLATVSVVVRAGFISIAYIRPRAR